jgi:radical SAM protein with 4Fe4S-binding SPASM domain
VVFTGGEPTLVEFLPELVAYAESKGLITGLNTNGRKLRDEHYLQELIKAGLDHIQITLESSEAQIHDEMVGRAGAWQDTIAGIKNAVSQHKYVMTNTTMLQTNRHTIADTLEFLAQLGVKTVGLNALIHSGKGNQVESGLDESELQPLLKIATEITKKHNQRLIWYTPTQYCHFDPVCADLGVKGCTAAYYNMCVEPDGMVIPCQSYYSGLGKLLYDTWSSIWEHPLAISLRERRNLPEACNSCAFKTECGGGCPLSYETIRPAPEKMMP